MADGLKLIQKESILPEGRDDLAYKVAPSTAYLLFELIPDNISPMGIMAINANNMITLTSE